MSDFMRIGQMGNFIFCIGIFVLNAMRDHHNPVRNAFLCFPQNLAWKHNLIESNIKCYLDNLVVVLEVQCTGVVGSWCAVNYSLVGAE